MTTASSYLVQIIPSSSPGHRHQGQPQQEQERMVALMYSLVLDQRWPVSLEIAATAQERRFLLRATSEAALMHACTQLHARLPQVRLVPVAEEDDPLTLLPGSRLSAQELRPGQAHYFPLRLAAAQKDAMADPILGVLGALDHVPEGMHLLSQLVIVPAKPNWADQRKAIVPALADSGVARERGGHLPSLGPGWGRVLLSLLAVGLLFLWQGIPQVQQIPLIQWVVKLVVTHLTPEGLVAETVGVFVLAALVGGLVRLVRGRLRAASIYDKELVRRKTMGQAYRARLRIWVLGPVLEQHARPRARVSPRQAETHGISWWFRGGPASSRERVRNVERLKKSVRTFFPMVRWYARRCWWQLRTALRIRWGIRHQHQAHLARLVAAYRQFAMAAGAGNYFVPRRIMRVHSLLAHWWRGVRHSSHFIDAETVAALWHLPPAEVVAELSQVHYRQERTLPLPPALEQVMAALPTEMGWVEHAGHRASFCWPVSCLLKHLLVVGKSGAGKSTCIAHLAALAMQQGGLVLIDPHGDLAEQVLRVVPAHRREDVVWIDLADQDYAVALNPLDVTLGRKRDKAISDLLAALSHIWDMAWGPRMENAFEMALRTLFEANIRLVAQGQAEQQYTLLDVMSVLTDESFCHALLEQIEDVFLLRWWDTYYDPLSFAMQRDRVDPVLSKVAKFEHVLSRRIVGQSCSTLDMRRLVAEQKIVLVKLAKGMIGEDIALVLGATLLNLLQSTLEEQGHLVAEERVRLPVIVDEFQTLVGVDWEVLAELRKYGAAFCLATQSMQVLREQHAVMLPLLLSNMQQYILFQTSAPDAALLAPEVRVELEDVVALSPHVAFVRLAYGDLPATTSSVRWLPPPGGDAEQADHLRRMSQPRYGRPVLEIDVALLAARARARGMQPRGAADPSSPQPEEVDQSMPPSPATLEESTRHLARQHGGSRGRPGQRARWDAQRAAESSTAAGSTTPMNWTETVGSISFPQPEEEGGAMQEEEDAHETQ